MLKVTRHGRIAAPRVKDESDEDVEVHEKAMKLAEAERLFDQVVEDRRKRKLKRIEALERQIASLASMEPAEPAPVPAPTANVDTQSSGLELLRLMFAQPTSKCVQSALDLLPEAHSAASFAGYRRRRRLDSAPTSTRASPTQPKSRRSSRRLAATSLSASNLAGDDIVDSSTKRRRKSGSVPAGSENAGAVSTTQTVLAPTDGSRLPCYPSPPSTGAPSHSISANADPGLPALSRLCDSRALPMPLTSALPSDAIAPPAPPTLSDSNSPFTPSPALPPHTPEYSSFGYTSSWEYPSQHSAIHIHELGRSSIDLGSYRRATIAGDSAPIWATHNHESPMYTMEVMSHQIPPPTHMRRHSLAPDASGFAVGAAPFAHHVTGQPDWPSKSQAHTFMPPDLMSRHLEPGMTAESDLLPSGVVFGREWVAQDETWAAHNGGGLGESDTQYSYP